MLLFMKNRSALTLLLFAGFCLPACDLLSGEDSGDGTVCTEQYVYGLTVSVQDEAGGPVSGATVTAVDQVGTPQTDFEDAGDSGTFMGLGEATGTFTVTISKAGFVTQETSVTLESDGCHVVPQILDITLVASP